MNRLFFNFLLGMATFVAMPAMAGNLWQQVDNDAAPQKLQWLHPEKFRVYTLDEATLRLQLSTLSTEPVQGIIITLPLPDGTTRDFKIWQAPMMPDVLAAKYPGIKTFNAEALDDHHVTAKLDLTLFGFHAMIFDGGNTSFIDPYDNYDDGFYMVHYKSDETRSFADRMKCQVHGIDDRGPAGQSIDIKQDRTTASASRISNGYQVRTYRLALACDNQYAVAATGLSSPTVAQTFSKMTTTVNRINGIYERELSIHMDFVSKEDTLIFTSPVGDPYAADNLNPGGLLSDNQTECDNLIGNANYDMGHVLTTGGGGYSLEGILCQTYYKAQSETGSGTPVGDGFDVDYVSHEMGHEFGADHSFNNGSDGNCSGVNRNGPTAYEPGSGSTVMAYAGICYPDDLQPHSDPYFHAVSLGQIQYYVSGEGDECSIKTSSENKLVNYPSFSASYSIPYLTPFELTAPALTDSVPDTSTLYCWEEWDLGDPNELKNTHANGPIFRSFAPVTSATRIFPKLSLVLNGILSDAGNENAEGEKAPDVARTLTFKCTFRDIFQGNGCFTFPDDQVTLNAVNTGEGFKVTSQGASGISYDGHSGQSVTWNVVHSNASPINAANVNIYMSVDGGYTWPYIIGNFPNTGSANITVPNPPSTSSHCRFKVKGDGNVFFNLNGSDFSVSYDAEYPVSPMNTPLPGGGNVSVYPVPAQSVLHVSVATDEAAVIYNAIGQRVWRGDISSTADISVAFWARGVYFLRLVDTNKNMIVKKFVLQ